MSKKTVIVISILVLVILIGSSIFAWKNMQKVVQQKQIVAEQQVNNEQQARNEVADENEQKPIVDKDLSDQEKINRLKNDENLVWYKVPELGIRFKVTKDSNEDWSYYMERNKEFNETTASFYSKSLKIFFHKDSKKIINLDNIRGSIISKISEKNNKISKQKNGRFWCLDDYILARIGNDIYCSEPPQSYMFDSWQQEQAYKETIKDKNFGVYFNTIEALNK